MTNFYDSLKQSIQNEAKDVVRRVHKQLAKMGHAGATLAPATVWESYTTANDDGTPASVTDVAFRMAAMLDRVEAAQ